MKTLLISLLLTILSNVNLMAGDVSIQGNIDLRPGETTVLGAYPNNSAYTYVWDFEQHNAEANFSYIVSGNQITITHLNNTQYSLLGVYCTVYDENGNMLGSDYVEIVVQP